MESMLKGFCERGEKKAEIKKLGHSFLLANVFTEKGIRSKNKGGHAHTFICVHVSL